jgi:hypothetical protein
VEALPPAQRRAVDLVFFEDLTHEQVATELHLPLGTAKTRIRAGLRQLRANLVGARGGGAGVCSGGLLARRTGCAGARHTRARPVHVTRECADPARSHARRSVGGARRSSPHGSSGPVVCEVRAPWGSDRSFQVRFTNL